jgi:hypothetical protein
LPSKNPSQRFIVTHYGANTHVLRKSKSKRTHGKARQTERRIEKSQNKTKYEMNHLTEICGNKLTTRRSNNRLANVHSRRFSPIQLVEQIDFTAHKQKEKIKMKREDQDEERRKKPTKKKQ